ncbi:hypothetical protein Tco_0312160 [Tanacetum coccineum]
MPPRMTTPNTVLATVCTPRRKKDGGNEEKWIVSYESQTLDYITQQLQNLLLTIVAQVGKQGRNQGNGRNQNGDAINDNIRGDIRDVIANNDRKGYTYKFLACNLKEYDGKGGVIVNTHWIEKMKSVQNMSGCEIAGTLADEALRNGSIKNNPEKRRNRGEPSKDRNVRDDNKRTKDWK